MFIDEQVAESVQTISNDFILKESLHLEQRADQLTSRNIFKKI